MAIIEDYGRKVGGARKDAFTDYLDRIGQELSLDPEDVRRMTLAEIFPAPNYDSLSSNGVPARSLAIIAVLRSSFPPKPADSAGMLSWAVRVARARGAAADLLGKGAIPVSDEALGRMPGAMAAKVRFTEGFPAGQMAEAARYEHDVRNGELRLFRRAPSAHAAKFVARLPIPAGMAPGEAFRNAVAAALEKQDDAKRRPASTLAQRALKHVKVYGSARGRAPFSVDFVKAGARLTLAGGFRTPREAFLWRQQNAGLIEERLGTALSGPPEHLDRNLPRVGPPRREGDVSARDLAREFGLSGIEFGNYVEGKRRQSDLNRAWDALADLAEAIGIERRDIGFRGALALAFGSRGNGHASAHFERDRRVINLTKTSGAGALAHEWFHAWDNAMAIRDDRPEARSTLMGSDGAAASSAVAVMFGALKASWGPYEGRMRLFDVMRSKPYWSTPVEMAARCFEALVSDRLEAAGRSNDYLVAIHRNEGAYPSPEESAPVFAALGRAFPGSLPIAAAETQAPSIEGAAVPAQDDWPDEDIVWAAGPR